MKKFLLLLSLLISLNSSNASEIKDKTERSIRAVFGEGIKLDFKKYEIPIEIKVDIQNIAKQAFFRNEVYTWKMIKNNATVGYAILDNVMGKSLPITFLVMFDLDGNIISSEIIKYREPIGGAIRSKGWNKQFIGKNHNSNFIVGRNIAGITGATISVSSVSKGIKKLTYLIVEIKDGL